MSLTPHLITGYSAGLVTNKKPFLLPDQAWQRLYNAYVWRERVKRREGLSLLGRLSRTFTNFALPATGAGTTYDIANLFVTLGITDTNKELAEGSITITVGAPDSATFIDNGNGTFAVTGKGISLGSFVNYLTGQIHLKFTPLVGGAAVTISVSYYPTIPVMGTMVRDQKDILTDQTIWFDQTYAYINNGTQFLEFIPGTTWAGTNSDFFWGYNYRGATPDIKLLFVTNFVNDAADPMRYTDSLTWTPFAPIIADAPNPQSKLYQARIIVAYYGYLLALNVWEGTTAGGPGGAKNIGNRCRGSQLGDPTDQVNGWRTDIFGRGFFIDAPTNEDITSATFIKNTLVVTFETTTWQLRFVGNYGLPFIWERISSDFGCDSTFSSVLFDNNMLTVGDKGIVAANGIAVNRIDLDIPEQVFTFENQNNGTKRIYGIRDYEKDIVYWNFPDSNTQAAPAVAQIFPNYVLVYNYRNNTWAIFRDSITSFGTFLQINPINWDRLDIFWDDNEITWDTPNNQSLFPSVVAGNQQGFVHEYGYISSFQNGQQASLTIQAINLSVNPITITSPNHNLQNEELIYIQKLNFLDSSTFSPLTTSLNDNFYLVTVIDVNTISIAKWNTNTQRYENNFPYTFTPTTLPSGVTYVGGGVITLAVQLDLISKDINIYMAQGLQTKLAYIDFLMSTTQTSQFSINLNTNTSNSSSGNLTVGQKNLSTVPSQPFYSQSPDYSWFRFYATLSALFFNIEITYSNDVANSLDTYEQDWTMYAIRAFMRPGGRNQF